MSDLADTSQLNLSVGVDLETLADFFFGSVRICLARTECPNLGSTSSTGSSTPLDGVACSIACRNRRPVLLRAGRFLLRQALPRRP